MIILLSSRTIPAVLARSGVLSPAPDGGVGGALLSISRTDGKERRANRQADRQAGRQTGDVAAVPGESRTLRQKTALKNNLYRNSF